MRPMRLTPPPTPSPQPFLWLDEKIREDLGLPRGSTPGKGAAVPRAALNAWKSRKLWQTVAAASRHSLYYRKHWQARLRGKERTFSGNILLHAPGWNADFPILHGISR